jgi:pimeloyl-ACP methyl ester carboxylesterase
LALRSLAGGSLFAEAIGVSSPTVLALHGWGRRGSDFTNSLVSFGALAVDLPGFGASPVPPAVWGARDYAENLRSVLDEFDRPPVVVGHSFGGRVAVCLAASYPELVGPVLVTGAPLVRLQATRKPPFQYRAARKLNDLNVVSDATIEKMKKNRGSADYRAATGVMRDILVKVVNEEYREELARQTKPVKLLWGENDREVPIAVANESARLIVAGGGEADVEVVDDVGHHLPTQAPDSLRAAVGKLI